MTKAYEERLLNKVKNPDLKDMEKRKNVKITSLAKRIHDRNQQMKSAKSIKA
jgi:hypothetical protein